MILFIEDEPFFNESYKEILESSGYRVQIERDINKAIDIFKTRINEIQLVILDIMMDIPNKLPSGFNIDLTGNGSRTGEEILRLLNTLPKGTEVPKIILTNVADEGFHIKYRNSKDVKGCYKKKEVNLGKLVEIVNAIINKD